MVRVIDIDRPLPNLISLERKYRIERLLILVILVDPLWGYSGSIFFDRWGSTFGVLRLARQVGCDAGKALGAKIAVAIDSSRREAFHYFGCDLCLMCGIDLVSPRFRSNAPLQRLSRTWTLVPGV